LDILKDSNLVGTSSIWHNLNFVKLWSGQTVSVFGSAITSLAIPLTAAMQLNATPLQMGVVQMMGYLPFLLFGLLAGVWVDRLPRRPVLVVADIGRALALVAIPIAAWGGWLSMELMYGVIFVVGTLNLLFEAAYAAFLPTIVPAARLPEGNSRLHASAAVAEIAGPGLAGWLVQVFTAAFSLVVDALSFVASAWFLLLMRVSETPRASAGARQSLWRELGEGLGAVLRHPYIRPLTFCSASANIFINMHLAIYVLYLTRELQATPGQIGLLYSVGSIGGLFGALYAVRVARRLGVGRAIMTETIVVGVAAIAVPLCTMMGLGALPLLALVHGVWGFWLPIYVVNAATLRQLVTRNDMLGRVTASSRFVSWGGGALGFLLGGLVAEQIGLLPTLLLAGVGVLLSAAWIVFSPVRTLQAMPEG
jgi:MFS family permease